MRALVSCLVLLSVILVGHAALAQKVVIARTTGDQRIANRVNAELTALGYHVEVVSQAAHGEVDTLRRLAASRGAIAGMRASPSKTGIELWIAKPGSRVTAFEEVVTVHSGRNDELLALRAVEVLRARLLKLGVHGEPQAQRPPVAAAQELTPAGPLAPGSEPAEPMPVLWTRLGVAYHYAHDELSNHESALLGLGLLPSPSWAVTVFALLPLRHAEVSTAAGTATARPTLFAVAASAQLTHGWFRVQGGAGVGAALLDVEGQADAPYRGQQRRLVSGLGFTRGGVGAQLTTHIALHAELLAGVTAPATVIRINDNEVATWGKPLLVGSLSLEIGVLTLRH